MIYKYIYILLISINYIFFYFLDILSSNVSGKMYYMFLSKTHLSNILFLHYWGNTVKSKRIHMKNKL